MSRSVNQDTFSAEFANSFETQLPGKVLIPSSPEFDQARAAWNAAVDQYPAAIIFPETAQDVMTAVSLANVMHLPVAVQATGHGVICAADGAVLTNTSRLQGLKVDSEKGTAWVGGGVKWGRVLAEAQKYGLAPLLGSSPDVGAVGYTLGGGMGWLCRKFGLSIDSLLRVEIVTPDGVLRQASLDENPDLFWALRGGGGGFGVVTGMQIRLHPVSQVYAGNLLYPAGMAKEVFTRFGQWIENAPDELTTSISLMNFPPIPDVPEILRGQTFVIVRGCYVGEMEEGERLMAFWRDWHPPLIDQFQALPFTRAAEISQDPLDPTPFCMTSGWLRELSSELIDALIRYTLPQGGPPAIVFSEVRLSGGAVARVDPESCAYSHRSETLIWASMAIPLSAEHAVQIETVFDSMRAALGPALSGKSYMNFLDRDEAHDRTHEGYSDTALKRLREIKAKYDPDYRFSYGYNFRLV
jgi:FAD/FMN-containing dehydrogenase